ncbi:MAG: asparaginase [Acidobacteria bacterium]|nr:asparaginase [Acidobacteriota bacterium]
MSVTVPTAASGLPPLALAARPVRGWLSTRGGLGAARGTVVALVVALAVVTSSPDPLEASALSAQADDVRPVVRLVATGGTISNRDGGRLTADDMLAAVPQLAVHVRAEAEQFSNVASTSLTLGQWLDLARRLNELFATRPDLAGLVVTMGTDTLEELAYFLHLTVRDPRPVVVVGAMRNPSTVGYEGEANLLAGFRVAADPVSRGKGVLVVLNDEINSARDVAKTDAHRLHTFQTRAWGQLGVVDRDRVVYHREPLRRHTARSEFDVTGLGELPRVDVLLVYQDAPGDLIVAAADAGARGVVLATAGAGSMSVAQEAAVRAVLDRGLIVVRATRTGGGRIAPRTGGPSLPGTGSWERTVAADDLSPVKARVLLMLALARSQRPDEVQRMFAEY